MRQRRFVMGACAALVVAVSSMGCGGAASGISVTLAPPASATAYGGLRVSGTSVSLVVIDQREDTSKVGTFTWVSKSLNGPPQPIVSSTDVVTVVKQTLSARLAAAGFNVLSTNDEAVLAVHVSLKKTFLEMQSDESVAETVITIQARVGGQEFTRRFVGQAPPHEKNANGADVLVASIDDAAVQVAQGCAELVTRNAAKGSGR